MKKITILIAVCTFGFMACNSAEREFGAIYDSATKEILSLNESLKSAKDGAAAAASINRFVALIKDAKEKSTVLTKKYGFKEGEIPASLQKKSDALVEASKKFGEEGMMAAMKKYANAPEVREAINKLKDLK